MEKVYLWCDQPLDRGRLKNRKDSSRLAGNVYRLEPTGCDHAVVCNNESID